MRVLHCNLQQFRAEDFPRVVQNHFIVERDAKIIKRCLRHGIAKFFRCVEAEDGDSSGIFNKFFKRSLFYLAVSIGRFIVFRIDHGYCAIVDEDDSNMCIILVGFRAVDDEIGGECLPLAENKVAILQVRANGLKFRGKRAGILLHGLNLRGRRLRGASTTSATFAKEADDGNKQH